MVRWSADLASAYLVLLQDPLTLDIGERRLMLVKAGDKHSIRSRVCRARYHLPPALVGRGTNFAKIDSDDNNRLFGTNQHQTFNVEWIVNLTRWFDKGRQEGVHQAVASRRQ